MKIITLLLAVCFYFPLQDVELTTIFNGEDFEGWVLPEDNIWWSVQDGVMHLKSGPEKKGSILWTDRDYTDFIIECDFKMGDGTVDSGIFIRSDHDQIQIGESGSLKRDMTCSPYIPGKGYPVEAENIPTLLNMEDWNTIRVRAIGDKYTVWLNGEEVMNYTSETATEKGPIGIQLHPNRDMTMEYKNIKCAAL